MVMVDDAGQFDVVTSVEPVALDRPVYDLDVHPTHNFVADGIVTHNSVYGFRGADFRNLMRFEEEFPESTIILLEQNYRSTKAILDAANAVIANNAARKPKNLWTEQVEGELLTSYQAEDEHDEAAFVIREVQRLTETEGQRFGDIAVFYRTNAQSRVIEESFVRAGSAVPGRRRREVLRPPRGQGHARLPARAGEPRRRGVVEADRQHAQARRRRHVGRQGRRVRASARASRSAHALREAAAVGITGRTLSGIRNLLELMTAVEQVTDAGVGRTVEAILEHTGYLAELEVGAHDRGPGEGREPPGARRRVPRVRPGDRRGRHVGPARDRRGRYSRRRRRWRRHDRGRRPRGLDRVQAFLEAISLVTDLDAAEDDPHVDGDPSAVTLMTLHSAKGLEFPVVFMTGLEDGIFPHIRSLGDPDQLEEERRLCYVGITRARERLYLCHAWSRMLFGRTDYYPPSRFLAEIPEELVHAIGEERPRGGRDSHRDAIVDSAMRGAAQAPGAGAGRTAPSTSA